MVSPLAVAISSSGLVSEPPILELFDEPIPTHWRVGSEQAPGHILTWAKPAAEWANPFKLVFIGSQF